MATELAAAYVTIIPSLDGAVRTIEKALGGVNTKAVGQKAGKTYVSGFKVGIGTITKLVSTAIAGIASYGFIKGGIDRAMNIDQATMKFEAMGIDVEAAMASCNEAVMGTAYSLDAAAVVAASLSASGVAAGEDLTKALKMTAGLAAMSGRSMEDIGLIVGKVAAQGKMQGDEMMQLAESGVAVLPTLAKYLGLTTAETQTLISKGLIDFQTFSDAMYATFGEAAFGANETFSGAMANVNSALNRISAKFATPALENLRRVFVALIPAINAVSATFDPIVEKFTAFTTSVADHAIAGIEKFTDVLTNGGSFAQAFAAGIGTAFNGTSIGNFVQRVSSAFAVFMDCMRGGTSLTDALRQSLSVLTGVSVSAVLDAIGSFGGLVDSGLSPLTALKTVLAELSHVTGIPFFENLGEKLANIGGPLSNAINRVMEFFGSINVGGAVAAGGFALILAKFGAPLTTLVKNVGKFGGVIAGFFGKFSSYGGIFAFIGTKIRTFGSAVTLCGGGVKGFATVIGSGLKTALMGLFSPVTLIVAGIAALAAAFVYLMTTNKDFRNTIMDLVSTIGQSLAPVIETIIGTVTMLVSTLVPIITDLVADLVPVLGQIITVIMQVVAALAPVIATVLNVIIPIVGSLISIVVSAASSILQAVIPVVSKILSKIQMAMPIIQAIIEAAMSAVQAIIKTVWPAIEKVISSAMKAIQAVINIVCSIISGDWSGVWQGIKDFVSAVWDAISSVVAAAIGAVAGVINGVLAFIKSIWDSVWGWVSSFVGDTWDSVCEAVSNGVQSAIDFVSGIPDAVMGFFSDAGSWLVDAGKNILQGLWDGIVGAKDWLVGKIKGIADWIIENKGPKSYDLKMLVPNGQWIMTSLCTGIENGTPKLQKTLSGVTSQVKDWSADIQPYQSVDSTLRTWSNAHIVTSDERDEERTARYEQALKKLGDRIEGMRVVMDSGELVGATASKYDRALSRRQLIAERGF